jgi:hypothetical protein
MAPQYLDIRNGKSDNPARQSVQRGNAMFYVWIALAILGAAAVAASLTVVHGYAAPMLLAVLGGALIQAGIAAFAMNFGRAKSSSRRRRYEMRTAA